MSMITTRNDLCTSLYICQTKAEGSRLVIFALYDVEAGEELCISYKGLPVSPMDTLSRDISDISRRKKKSCPIKPRKVENGEKSRNPRRLLLYMSRRRRVISRKKTLAFGTQIHGSEG
jgi:hypothetical protein